MPSLWNSLFVAWIAWCTVAYGSSRIGSAVVSQLASPLAAVLAAVLGVVLGWQAWLRLRGASRHREWLRLREWSRASCAAVLAGGLWIVIQALDLFAGKFTNVFGIYVVLALIAGVVPQVTRAGPQRAVPHA